MLPALEIQTQQQARALFWSECSDQARAAGLPSKRQNQQPADVRAEWCEWIDRAARDGRMSETLAQRVTL